MFDEKILNHLLHDVKLAASCFMDDDPTAALIGAVKVRPELDGQRFETITLHRMLSVILRAGCFIAPCIHANNSFIRKNSSFRLKNASTTRGSKWLPFSACIILSAS